MGIEANFIHEVSVTRRSRKPANGVPAGTPCLVFKCLYCQVTAVTGMIKETLLSRIGSSVKKICWGTEDLQEGDEVTYKGQSYILRETEDFRDGPGSARYQIAKLVQATGST